MPTVVGIDLGTSKSSVAVFEGGEPRVIGTREGARSRPSVVAFDQTGKALVGEPALQWGTSVPNRAWWGVKRSMGTDQRLEVDAMRYRPEEISAFILQKLKEDAEDYLGYPVRQAVISVSHHFNLAQRQATRNAARIAGLEVLRLCNDATLAAMAYGRDKQDQMLSVLVLDLGGGTLDATLLEIGGGIYEVMATEGDTRLGGDDWDDAIADELANDFQRHKEIDLRADHQAMRRLRRACEEARRQLSTVSSAGVSVPFIASGGDSPLHLEAQLTRSSFEATTRPLTLKCVEHVNRVFEGTFHNLQTVDRILLVGGATRMPMIADVVRRVSGKEPSWDVNPDESVALGAAIAGGILTGQVEDMVAVELLTHPLGVETAGGATTPIIRRNAAIPKTAKQTLKMRADYSGAANVHIVEGEYPLASDNLDLGTLRLTDLHLVQGSADVE